MNGRCPEQGVRREEVFQWPWPAVIPVIPSLQINMYLTSRVLFALCRLGVEKGYIPEPRWNVFPLHTAVFWGLVLWLFEYHRPMLQPSLQSSMTYLYEDSNIWHDISDFLIYNKSSSPSK
jgi:peroxisomal membrane protein 4